MKDKLIDISLIFLSVILLTIASPGFDISYLAFIAYIPLIYAIKKRSNLPSMLYGIIFGFSYFFINLNWLNVTVSQFGNTPIIIGYLVLIAFALYLSIYFAVFSYLSYKKDDIIILSMIFVVLEVIKSYALTGFPWLNLGLTQYSNKYTLQLASIIGEYGLSFIIILVNFLIYKYIVNKSKVILSFTIIILLISFSTGYLIFNSKNPNNKNYKFSIIQPSYNQLEKWDYKFKNKIINRVNIFLEDAVFSDTDFIIMPEAVYPVFLEREKYLLSYLKNLSKSKPIILGSLKKSNNKNYNSVYYIYDNKIIDSYDKKHLVPFGEYMPMGKLLAPVSRYFFGESADFSSGDKTVIFNYDDKKLRIAPLICYESIYTDIVLSAVYKGANILTVVTNDSWFGNSIGRVQHLALSVIRAVEVSRPTLRAAQSGISACIDSKGQIVKSLQTDKPGILTCSISPNNSNTIFNKFQYGWILIIIAIVFYRNIKKKKDNVNQ